MDYYQTLGVPRNASDSDLKKAYKKASMQHHPDRGGDEAKFKEINEAYSTLKDPNKRAEYDNPQPRFAQGLVQMDLVILVHLKIYLHKQWEEDTCGPLTQI